VAAVELAIPLPLLVFVFLVAVDFCRIFYFVLTVENCARNGALWACDAYGQTESPYANVTTAARADFPESSRSQLSVTDPASVIKKDGIEYVQVTCTYSFQTITSYPGIAGPWNIQRSAWARVVPGR